MGGEVECLANLFPEVELQWLMICAETRYFELPWLLPAGAVVQGTCSNSHAILKDLGTGITNN